jgi:hypothetical protein
MQTETSSPNNYLYFLSNPAMPGLLKIGMTTRTVEQRIRELRHTGIPHDFKIEVYLSVQDAAVSEKIAHNILSKQRLNNNREFFKIDIEDALELVLPLLLNYTVVQSEPYIENKSVQEYIKIKNQKEASIRQRHNQLNTANSDYKKLIDIEKLKERKIDLLKKLDLNNNELNIHILALVKKKKEMPSPPVMSNLLSYFKDILWVTSLPVIIILFMIILTFPPIRENSVIFLIVLSLLFYMRHERKNIEEKMLPLKTINLKINELREQVISNIRNHEKLLSSENLEGIDETSPPSIEIKKVLKLIKSISPHTYSLFYKKDIIYIESTKKTECTSTQTINNNTKVEIATVVAKLVPPNITPPLQEIKRVSRKETKRAKKMEKKTKKVINRIKPRNFDDITFEPHLKNRDRNKKSR